MSRVTPKVGFVSLGCPKALVDSERILTQLRVEGYDAGGQSVGETSTWTFGNIAPGGRGHFVVPPLPRATTYRITVSAFDRVSRQEPSNIQSP